MGGDFFLKFIKFCAVGASGVIVDFGITYLCKELLRLNKYVANSIGFIFAATSNYFLNRLWTFGSTDPDIGRQYAVFIAISLVGLALNNLILWLANDKLKVNFSAIFGNKSAKATAKINFYSSKLVAIVIVTAWNFLMNYFFNF